MHDIDAIVKELEREPLSLPRAVPLPPLSREDLRHFVPQYDEAEVLHADVRGSGISAKTAGGDVTVWKVSYKAGYLVHATGISEHEGVHYVLEIRNGQFSEMVGSQRLAPTYELLQQEMRRKDYSA